VDAQDAQWRGGHLVKWENLQMGDIGRPVSYPTYTVRSVQVVGTFGGASMLLEGSNMPTSPTYVGLLNPWYGMINLSEAGLKAVLENTYWVRPRIMGGDATTDLDVYFLCVTER